MLRSLSTRSRQTLQKAFQHQMRAPPLARDRCQTQIVKTRVSLERTQPPLLHPKAGVVIRQITDIAPGQNQKRHALSIRRTGGAIERLIMRLNFCWQPEGRRNRVLAVETLILELFIVDIKQ